MVVFAAINVTKVVQVALTEPKCFHSPKIRISVK